MVSITRLQSNQAVLTMVYPRLAFIGKKNENSPKFCPGGWYFGEKLYRGDGLLNENFSGPGVIPGGE